MTNTLLKSYQREYYFRSLLSDKNGLLNVQVSNFNSVFNYNTTEDLLMIIKISNLIDNLSLDVLNPYKQSLVLHKEILQLYKIMHVYNLTPDVLLVDFKKNQEIKHIMDYVFPLESTYLDALKEFKQNLNDYELIDHYINDPLQIKIMSSSSAQFNIKPIRKRLPEQVFAYHAKNARVEIEGIAQEIIKNNYDINRIMIINNNINYYPIIKQVFTRYNLPFSIISDKESYMFVNQYLSIIELLQTKSLNSLLSCFDKNSFNITNNYKLHQIVSFFEFDIEDFLTFDFHKYTTIDSRDLKYMHSLINDCQADIDTVKSFLNTLLEKSNFKALNTLIYNHLSNYISKNEISGFNTLKNVLETLLPLIDNYYNKYELLIDQLKTIKKDIPFKTEGVITVTDNVNFYLEKDIVFITGCNSKDFFNLTTYTGLIDEHYLSHIPFITYRERYDNHNKHLHTMFYIGKMLYISYSYSDYTGGKKEVAFEVENILKELSTKLNKDIRFQSLEIIENDYLDYKTYEIDPKLYNQLIIKDDILTGSISSFEQFIGSPYAFFLNKGLGLKTKQLPDISYATVGNLVHDTLNKLAKNLKDKYSQTTTENIESYIVEQFNILHTIHPTKPLYLKLLSDRFIELIERNINYLSQVDNNTSLKVNDTEKYYNIVIGNINIRGIIDRIDTSETYFRVIDYKTGPKAFSLKEVLSGQQLQLLTYLYVGNELYDLKPMGAYYYAVNIPTINVNNYTVNFAKHVMDEQDNSSWINLYNSSKRLDGITFGDQEVLDYTGMFVKTPRSKDKYDFNKVNQYISEMYTSIYNRIKAGDISCEPLENSYALHDYQVIAQYKGKTKKPVSLVTITDFKENSDEMES